jgi:PAS domain S-box-containing protein
MIKAARQSGVARLADPAQARLATLVRDSNDAVIIRDLEDRVVTWNNGAENLYGYSEAEALGMDIRRIIPKGRRIRTREWYRLVEQEGKSAPLLIQRRAKDGKLLDVLLTVTVLRDGKGRPVEVATTERDITELKEAERQLRCLHTSVISAQETERKRLARELHDGVGQILSGIKFRLQAFPDNAPLTRKGEAWLKQVAGFLDHAIAELRRVSQNLMPSELVDLGLEPALRALCREVESRSGIRVTVRTVPVAATPELALAFYRIAQEALSNVEKHSKATMVSLVLARKGKDAVLSVRDNGIGFAPARRLRVGRGMGLGNLRHRAESMNGTIELHSAPRAGTSLVVVVPLSDTKRASA